MEVELDEIIVRAPGPQGIKGDLGRTGPPGGGDSYVETTSEIAIGGGRFLHVLSSGLAVYADASAGLPAHGYTRAAVAAGDTILLYTGGLLTGLTGLTPGRTYWLSGSTPGLYALTPPTAGLTQPVGRSMSGDILAVDIDPFILLIS